LHDGVFGQFLRHGIDQEAGILPFRHFLHARDQFCNALQPAAFMRFGERIHAVRAAPGAAQSPM
jgi:hypothetical protein